MSFKKPRRSKKGPRLTAQQIERAIRSRGPMSAVQLVSHFQESRNIIARALRQARGKEGDLTPILRIDSWKRSIGGGVMVPVYDVITAERHEDAPQPEPYDRDHRLAVMKAWRQRNAGYLPAPYQT